MDPQQLRQFRARARVAALDFRDHAAGAFRVRSGAVERYAEPGEGNTLAREMSPKRQPVEPFLIRRGIGVEVIAERPARGDGVMVRRHVHMVQTQALPFAIAARWTFSDNFYADSATN